SRPPSASGEIVSMHENQVNRRDFLKTTGATAAAGTAVALVQAPAPAQAAGANGKIRIGFIGPGGRGFGAHVKSLVKLKQAGANIDLVAAADVYSVHRDRTADYIKKELGTDVATYVDYRDMIEKEKLD